jgi:hypothetical protein
METVDKEIRSLEEELGRAAAIIGGRFSVAGDAKVCLASAVYCLFCLANDFLDSTDYAADTSFTATCERDPAFFSRAAVTQLA